MTIRTLFNVILKIIGILFFSEFFFSLINFLSLNLDFSSASFNEVFWNSFPTLIVLLAYGLVFYYFIFRTNAVLDKLKLDKDMDQQDLSLNIPIKTILSIAVIVIGGLMVAREIPNFIRQLVVYIQQRRLHPQYNGDFSLLIVSGARLMIGLLLIGYQQQIVNFIERKQTLS